LAQHLSPDLSPHLTDLSAVIRQNLAVFEAASRRHDEHVTDLEVVGRRVRVRLAGTALADVLLGSLRHRQIAPDGPPDLTICVWDQESTRSFAVTGWARTPGEAGHDRILVRDDRAFLVLRGTGPWVVRGYDPILRTAFLWARDAGALVREGERTKPFLDILHSWLLDTSWQPVHGAAVGGPGGGVVLAGPSGAGKSTTALACVRAGWHYAGDDYVVIGTTAGPRVENLYASARLRTDMAERLVEFRPAEVGSVTLYGDEKRDLLLTHLLPGWRIGGFPARAILLPRLVSGRRSALRPAPAFRAMIALSSSTMHVLRTGAGAAFEKLGRFVSGVPAYWLDLGDDLEALPPLIAGETGAGPG
jgi:hypothetical protein